MVGPRTVVQLAEAGVPCCNPPDAVALTRKRPTLMAILSQARLPVPLTVAVRHWKDARAAATTLSVIKTSEGADGRGENVLAGTRVELPDAAPFPGPYVVQPFIANDGWDRKLYVAGERVRSLLKPSPLAHGHVTGGAPIAVDDTMSRLAGRVADVTGLQIFGVDFLMGEAGPVIVDVNPFPGFRGVGEGPAMITEHLLTRLD